MEQYAFLDCIEDVVNSAMFLVDGRMAGPKTKLIMRIDVDCSVKWSSLFNRTFSKIYEIQRRRLIGLYDARFSDGLFGFGISIMIECFQALESLTNALNNWDKQTMTLNGKFFIMKLVIKSCPEDLLTRIFLMILF